MIARMHGFSGTRFIEDRETMQHRLLQSYCGSLYVGSGFGASAIAMQANVSFPAHDDISNERHILKTIVLPFLTKALSDVIIEEDRMYAHYTFEQLWQASYARYEQACDETEDNENIVFSDFYPVEWQQFKQPSPFCQMVLGDDEFAVIEPAGPHYIDVAKVKAWYAQQIVSHRKKQAENSVQVVMNRIALLSAAQPFSADDVDVSDTVTD